MSEPTTYALKCPGCGASLKVGASIDSFACTYCGASVQVEHGDGIVSLRVLTETIRNVQRGTDKTAAELEIRRLPGEIRALNRELANLQLQMRLMESQQRDAQSDPPVSNGPLLSLPSISEVIFFLLKAVVVAITGIAAWAWSGSIVTTIIFGFGAFGLAFNQALRQTKGDRYLKKLQRGNAKVQNEEILQRWKMLRDGAEGRAKELTNCRRQEKELQSRLDQKNQKLAVARAIVDS